MNDGNVLLLIVLCLLLILAAVLKIKLAEKKGEPYSLGSKLQLFVFPVLMLLAIGLYWLDHKGAVVVLIFCGIVEEAVCWAIRKKRK